MRQLDRLQDGTAGGAARAIDLRHRTLSGDPLLAAIVAFARRALAGWQRRQLDRATYRALSALDDRVLHDLGFHRSEIGSVALEIAGGTNATRIRTRIIRDLHA